MWAAVKGTAFALRSVLHPHPPRSEPSACPWWHASTLAVWVWVGERDRDTNSRIHIAPLSACFFSCHPAVCCSFLCAQDICAMVTVPACQPRHRFHLSSASLPAWWLSSSCRASASPLLNLSDTPCSSDKVVCCSWPEYKTDQNNKSVQTNMFVVESYFNTWLKMSPQNKILGLIWHFKMQSYKQECAQTPQTYIIWTVPFLDFSCNANSMWVTCLIISI